MREPVITISWISAGLEASAVGDCARSGMQVAAQIVPSTRATVGALRVRLSVWMSGMGSDTPERFLIRGSLATRRFSWGAYLAKVVQILRNWCVARESECGRRP